MVKEQAVILEKIFYYNDVFNLDHCRIPNIAYFNEDKRALEDLFGLDAQRAKSRSLDAAECRRTLELEARGYFGQMGDAPFKVAIFCLAQVLICLPLVFNYL